MPRGVFSRSNWKMTDEARARAVATQTGVPRPSIQGSKHGLAKIHEEDVVEMRKLRDTHGWTHRAIARQFGISSTETFRICKREIWKHVD